MRRKRGEHEENEVCFSPDLLPLLKFLLISCSETQRRADLLRGVGHAPGRRGVAAGWKARHRRGDADRRHDRAILVADRSGHASHLLHVLAVVDGEPARPVSRADLGKLGDRSIVRSVWRGSVELPNRTVSSATPRSATSAFPCAEQCSGTSSPVWPRTVTTRLVTRSDR